MKNNSNSNDNYINSFFQACEKENISVDNTPNRKNTYAYLFNSKEELYKMYRNLDLKRKLNK